MTSNASLGRVAFAAGKTFFHGSACPACGGTKRYAISTACVMCARSQNAKHTKRPGVIGRPRNSARIAAMESGAKTYQGIPCQHCGGTERYTTSKKCIHEYKHRNEHKPRAVIRYLNWAGPQGLETIDELHSNDFKDSAAFRSELKRLQREYAIAGQDARWSQKPCKGW